MIVAGVHVHCKLTFHVVHIDYHAAVASLEVKRNTGIANPKALEFDAVEERWQHRSFDSQAALERIGNKAKDRLEQVGDGSCGPGLRVACHRIVNRRIKARSGKPGEYFR